MPTLILHRKKAPCYKLRKETTYNLIFILGKAISIYRYNYMLHEKEKKKKRYLPGIYRINDFIAPLV